MKLSEVIGEPSVVMYHMTPTINLRRIMTQGLVPKIGRRSRNLGERVAAIYLFHDIPSAEDALANWFGEEFGETTKIALLQVTVPLDATEVAGAQYERVLTSPIPPANIRVLHTDVGSLYPGQMSQIS